MPLTKGFQSATQQWEAFALALAASLAPFKPVRLAPKFRRSRLNAALATYLPLRDDELLLAMIDRGRLKATGRCALTTRRVYWTELDVPGEPAPGGESKRPNRRARQRVVVGIAAYADLPDRIAAIEVRPGSFAIDLGGGRTIELGRVDGRLAAALARYLETMCRSARAGTAPEGLIDSDLAARSARELPKVAQVTARARTLGRDVSDFRDAVDSATPHVLLTQVFTAACIAVYVAMVASGVSWLWPSTTQLIDWGANHGIDIALGREYWRLFTNIFLHGGLIHLAMNMWSLLVIGPLVERLYGNLAFAVIYLASGVGGSIASVAASPLRVGVGASGAICGLLGGLVAFLVIHRRTIPKSILKSFRGSLLWVVVLMAILGFLVPNIDQEAHLGGFVTGCLTGLLLWRPWPVVKSRWAALRRLFAPFLITAALAGFAHVVAQRATATIPAEVRLQSIRARISPALGEYTAINESAPSTLLLSRDRPDAHARAAHTQTIEALIERALANLTNLRRATTAYPPLQNMVRAMVRAQASQLSSLRAAQRYLETGDPIYLSGAGGALDEKIAAAGAVKSFYEQQFNFMRDSKLIKTQDEPDN
jgi:rhomboid protease GluP